ncbi:MAG: calcium/sodium antiporter [Rhodospirillales bacterium]|nr:calcium/sodium antiporter [Rhodospirillales bacterium]
MIYLELLGGLALLVAGAELLVRGSVGIARRLGVSPLLIGLTLVGFGTSSPELVASVTAALKGSPGIAVGNVVGSNICNLLLILGLSALFAPLAITRAAFLRDGPVLMAASVALVGVCLLGDLPRWVGVVFLVLLTAYIVWCYLTEKQEAPAAALVHEQEAASVPPLGGSLAMGIAAALAGLLLLVAGAYLLVGGAIELARDFGVSETIIGLTVVAIGTSLPELATSVVAAARGQSDVAFGNVVGSSIYNILGILGVTALVQPIPIPMEIVAFDIWVMLGSAVLLVMFAMTGWRINRWEGGVFLAAYGVYIAWLARAAAVAV